MPNNQTKPNQTQTTPIAGAGGVNRRRQEVPNTPQHGFNAEDRIPFTVRNRDIFKWAKDNLPDEYPRLVVSAYMTLALKGTPTAEAVMARLKAQGKSMEQMKAKGWA